MTLWIILTAMCSAAAILIAVPLVRRYEDKDQATDGDITTHFNQLKELERDLAQGMISAAEADLARVEIERRLLAAANHRNNAKPVSSAWRTIALASTGAFVVLGATNAYVLLGRPDLGTAAPSLVGERAAAEFAETTMLPETSMPAVGAGNVDDMIGGLAKRLEQTPSDAEGWRMLGWSYFNTQRYDESAAAYARAMALAPENLDYRSAYAEALVQAAGGIVTPKANELFSAILAADARNERARFYMALAREQSGDLSAALEQWISLLGDAPADAGWLVDVRQRISDLGQKTGRNVSAFLTDSPVTPVSAGPVPADQRAMVDGMITSLAARLKANPRDRDGWAMMIRSLKVQGDIAAARSALSEALAAFSDDPVTRDQIAAFAQSLEIGGSGAQTSGDTLPPASPGPTAQDVAASADMTPQDRQEMITGMVDRLAERLAKSPHDADGWMRLIRSRMVLNQPDMARDALRHAMTEFSSDPVTSLQIAQAAKQLGVSLD